MPTFAEAFALAAGRELGHCVGGAAQPVRVFDIVTEEMMPVTQEWCENMQRGNSAMYQQRQIAAWLLGLSPLRQAEAIAAMQSKAHELGMP